MEVYFLMYSENKLVCLHSTFVSVAFKLRRNCIMILMLPVMSTWLMGLLASTVIKIYNSNNNNSPKYGHLDYAIKIE